MNIFIANLNFNTNEQTIRDAFETYGAVDSVKIIFDKFSGKSKGFGFVEMSNEEEGTKAIEDLNESMIEDNKIVVKKAYPKNENRGGDRGGRRNFNRDGGGGGRDNYNRY